MKKRIIPILIILLMLAGIGLCYYMTTPVQSKSEEVEFIVNKGDPPRTIIKDLKLNNLIKSELFSYVYMKVNGYNKDNEKSFKAGTFKLNKNMSLKEIFNALLDSTSSKGESYTITFPEGKNMRGIISIITINTSITEEEILNKLVDQEYLKGLVNDYWFLTEDILNPGLYYSLEGYLAPDTYEIKKDATIEEIFKKMLDEEGEKLDPLKSQIESNPLGIHKIVTMASIAELEGKSLSDRKNIVGVFFNRINNGMSLGSDVTTYYGARVDMSERDLYQSEIDDPNLYNTRAATAIGVLPVGPICNPSKEAIDSVINYTPNDYFFFVSDKNGKIYFTKTAAEHQQIIDQLIAEGLWYTYDE